MMMRMMRKRTRPAQRSADLVTGQRRVSPPHTSQKGSVAAVEIVRSCGRRCSVAAVEDAARHGPCILERCCTCSACLRGWHKMQRGLITSVRWICLERGQLGMDDHTKGCNNASAVIELPAPRGRAGTGQKTSIFFSLKRPSGASTGPPPRPPTPQSSRSTIEHP